ncbi:hypothetical protein GALL_533630 [mine drainage metagenome]|uniref:Uncharacterized protein n=1 Tax=mine drainage metagenome TaxID=410659 RepID=A0A1J5P342_9ZZZZ
MLPLGDLCHKGPHLPRRPRAQFGNRRAHHIVAIAIQQRAQPLLPHHQRRRLGLHIANPLIRHADVGADDRVNLLVQHAFLEQPNRRQTQPFLLHRGRRGRKSPRHRATRIRPVSGVRQPAENLALPIERSRKAHVHQMRAAQIGVVDDVDITELRRRRHPRRDALDQHPRRILHGADKHRQAPRALRDQRAILGGIDAVRAVVRLGNHRREGRARKRQVHLVADLLQPGLNDGQRNRINHGRAPSVMTILPSASPVAKSPGSIRTVVSICSTMAPTLCQRSTARATISGTSSLMGVRITR